MDVVIGRVGQVSTRPRTFRYARSYVKALIAEPSLLKFCEHWTYYIGYNCYCFTQKVLQ